MNDARMTDEQKQLARELEPLFGPEAKEGDEVVLDDATRVVLAEDPDPAKLTVAAKVTLRPELAARTAASSRYGPPLQARFETPGDIAIEGGEP